MLACYALSHWLAPPIVRCAIAVSTVLWCAYVAAMDERPPLAFWGLTALALPVLPSLQFTLGFPLRVASATLTVGLLRIQGLAVERQGTMLAWDGRSVQFDAPCSGVAMLWAGLLVSLMAATAFRLGAARLIAALAFAVVATLAGNVLRTSSLFYIETGLIGGAAAWWHEGVGIAAFAVSAGASLWVAVRLADARRENQDLAVGALRHA
jgi:exosortase/archaeosortase family protein